MKLDRELLKGVTETVILAVLNDEPSHGYRLIRLLDRRSQGVFELGEGTLYPLLYKLEAKGWIKGEWEAGDGRRRRRVYRVTDRGRGQLAKRSGQWEGLAQGVALILGGHGEPGRGLRLART